MKSEVLYESRFSDAGALAGVLGNIDLFTAPVTVEDADGNYLVNMQLIEETLTDGSKVRKIVLS